MDQANNAVPPEVGAQKVRLSHAERAKRQARIPELFAQGWSDEQIATELGLTPAYVGECRIKLNLVRPRGRRSPTDAELQAREENIQQLCEIILELRRKGVTPKAEIIEKVRQPTNIVSECIRRLIAEGRTESWQGRLKGRVKWRDLADAGTQTVVQMVKDNATLQQIGDALGGLTGEYARQLIEKIRQVHGEKVLKSDKQWFSTREAAQILNIDRDLVSWLCHDGAVPCSRRSGASESAYVLDTQSIEALRVHPRVTRKKICRVCGKIFLPPRPSSWKRTWCSPECRRKYYLTRMFIRQPSLDSLEEWHRLLWPKLLKKPILADEKWIAIGEAARMSGLSGMQLWYMARRKILTTTQSETEKWRGTGTPLTLYPTSQVKLAGQVFRAWQRKQKRRKPRRKRKKSP